MESSRIELKPIQEVQKFHEMASLGVGRYEERMSLDMIELRVRLIAEETNETVHALTAPTYDTQARLETLDGLCDIVYVSAGTVVARGTAHNSKYASLNSCRIGISAYNDDNDDLQRGNLAEILLKNCKSACYMIRHFGDVAGSTAAMEIHTQCNVLNAICYSIATILELPFEAGFMEVQNANMSKRLPDGRVFQDKGGKLMKPPGFVKPDLAYVLEHGAIKERLPFTGLSMTPESIAKINGWILVDQQA